MNKISLALCVLTTTTAAFAGNDPEFTVLLRNERSNSVYYEKKPLPYLKSDSAFDGEYFKIVKGKGKDPVLFTETDEDLLLKAATVYYHLNSARDFWVHRIGAKTAQELPKLIIRLEITNMFDELGHFAHDKRNPQYNNALSTPPGETPSWVPEDKKDKWFKEIWFRPMKSISTSELPSIGPNPLTSGLLALERPLINYFENQFNNDLIEQVFYPAYANRSLQENVIRYAGTYALMKVFIFASRKADPLFIDKFYYLDTAMVPEIAYHEYAHVILSDHLEMSHSTPVNEGMADYFAAIQSGKRKVYAKVPGHSNASSKDTQEKKIYSHWDEANRNATSDFTLSVLWDVRETLGENVGDKVVYEARTYLKTSTSNISDGLLRAILRACEARCPSPRRDKLKLYEKFMKKGF